MRRRAPFVVLLVVFVVVVSATPAAASGEMAWPVTGSILRGFDGPDSPYSAGHRGIDIGAPVGTPILSPAPGVVSFAGKVAGSLYVSIDHANGVRSTCSWLTTVTVKKGDSVEAGRVIGTTGFGHPGSAIPHLHFGTKVDGTYVDPLSLLAGLDLSELIRLVPVA
jgi:murein DD-endopeptidase MepM/ murein hydrolase activator NlpD